MLPALAALESNPTHSFDREHMALAKSLGKVRTQILVVFYLLESKWTINYP